MSLKEYGCISKRDAVLLAARIPSAQCNSHAVVFVLSPSYYSISILTFTVDCFFVAYFQPSLLLVASRHSF